MNKGTKSFLLSLLVATVVWGQPYSTTPDLAQLKLAAKAGDAKAQYEYGDTIAASNDKESFASYLLSANQGYGPAEDKVGERYLTLLPYNEKNRPKWERRGVRYASRAAFKGIPHAQAQLSECYERGAALPKDPALAYAWMALALKSAGGATSPAAATYKIQLDELAARLPAAAVVEGQKLADNLKLGGSGMNPVEATVLTGQMNLSGLYRSDGAWAVVVNQTRFAVGETKSLPIDGEAVTLSCMAAEGRSAKFKLENQLFTLTAK